MARREEEDSAISLFSFQDIITSLTGIMFLVVLLLVLLLLSSHTISAPPQVEEHSEATALQEQLAVLKQELQELEQSQQQTVQRLELLRKLSPEEVKRNISDMEQKLRILQNNLQEAEAKLQIQQELLAQLQQEIAADNELKKNIQSELEQMQKQFDELQSAIIRQRKENENNKNLMKFSIERSTNKSPLLVELDKNGVIMLVVDTDEKIDYRIPGKAQSSIDNFLAGLNGFSSLRYYVCILVKPSGFPYAQELTNSLKNKNYERGIEIMPDDASTVFGGSQK